MTDRLAEIKARLKSGLDDEYARSISIRRDDAAWLVAEVERLQKENAAIRKSLSDLVDAEIDRLTNGSKNLRNYETALAKATLMVGEKARENE